MQQTWDNEAKRGTLAGVGCYVLWGTLPLYWKLLSEVDSLEIVAHRVIWCFVCTLLVCLLAKHDVRSLLQQPRAWRHLVPAAAIITVNWSVYVIAVNSGHVIESAIGYYINPLVSVVLGLVVFRERLSRLEWTAVSLCTFGIVYFTLDYGQFPWLAILLAVTFGIYGAIKKHGGYPAVPALAFENAVMVIPAIVFAVVLAHVTGTHAFLGDTETLHGWSISALLVFGGVVTAVPLVLFAKAANSIPLSMLGFIQYISPTLNLLLGVFLLGEPFTQAHAVCFGCIWTGIALVTYDAFTRRNATS